jgi:hypothetical protein
MTSRKNIYKKALNIIKYNLNISTITILIIFFISAKSELISKENSLNESKRNYLEMYGVIKLNEMFVIEGKKYIDSAEVEILNSDGKVLSSIQSNEAGQCFFRLPLNEQFILKVSKKGLVSKIINVDTHTSNEELKKYNLPFEIEMYEEIKDLEILLLREAIASVKYNYYINDFDYNYKYTNETNEKIKKIYADYYSLEGNRKRQTINNDNKKDSNDIKHSIVIDSIKVNNDTKTLVEDITSETITQNKVLSKTKLENSGVLTLNSIIEKKNNSKENLEFKIQIIALAGYLPSCANFFEKCGKADEYFHKGKYKYTLGAFNTYKSALSMLSYIKSIGYKDAFLVAFLNGERIELPKALSLQNSN